VGYGSSHRRSAELELGAHGASGWYTYATANTLRDDGWRDGAGAGNSSNDAGAGFEGSIDIEPGARIPLIPRHLFKALADWQPTRQVAVSADLIVVGGSFARGNENNEHEPDGLYYLGRGRAGGYAVVNLGAEYRPVAALRIYAQLSNLLDREYSSAAQLGPAGFNASGSFVARPFAGPVIAGERPLLGSTFHAPGAPRALWVGLRYTVLTGHSE
jgi:outer membrane receptor protein involved in Fe transport